jgi:hypothetical protein
VTRPPTSGLDCEPTTSGRQNLGTMRMLDAALRSSETGARIEL